MADDSDEEPPTPPEWTAHSAYIKELESSDDPLHQILANMETLDGAICGMGEIVLDEHRKFISMIQMLTEIDSQLVPLLEPTTYARLPTLILNLQLARKMIELARMQVKAYPALVDRLAVPPTAGADFKVRNHSATEPSDGDSTHTS